MPRFLVALSYTAECCSAAHLMAELVTATDKRGARRRLIQRAKRLEYEVGDVIVRKVPERAGKIANPQQHKSRRRDGLR